MKPAAELKSLVMSAAGAEASPSRRAVERRRAFSWLAAGLWVLLVFGGLGGMRAVERPIAFVVGTAAGWAAMAVVATWGASRGGSMLGRPRSALLWVVVATPLLLEVWYVGSVARSVVIPRAVPARLARIVFLTARALATPSPAPHRPLGL